MYSTSIATVSFGNSASVAASGDIRTLVDYEIYTSKELDTSKAQFTALFKDCVSLTSAPALPATKLADNCYSEMFLGCIALAEAPALPAMELTDRCYSQMFMGCTSLTKAPMLSASVLAKYSYNEMFKDCSNLSEVRMRAVDISATGCLSGWLSNVSPWGTLYKNSALEDISALEIPGDWEVKNW